jgi:hypothetical protein
MIIWENGKRKRSVVERAKCKQSSWHIKWLQTTAAKVLSLQQVNKEVCLFNPRLNP